MPDYFTLDELRALPDMADTVKYPDAALTAARDWITAIVERVCGTSFVSRTIVDTLDGSRAWGGALRLTQPWPRTITAITSNGVAFDSGALSQVALMPDGSLLRQPHTTWSAGFAGIPWDPGFANITVTYTAGFSTTPPADLKAVMLQAARYRVVSVDGKSGVPSRALSITNELGNVSLATAGQNNPTGIPDVDAVILGWAAQVRIPGVA